MAGRIGCNRQSGWILPGELLAFVRVQFTTPCRYAEEVQAHGCVRIGKYAGKPRVSGQDSDTELLVQLAHQRMVWRFARLDLAAGKFPVAGPNFVGGTLGQEKGVVWKLKDGGGNFEDSGCFGLFVHFVPTLFCQTGRGLMSRRQLQ